MPNTIKPHVLHKNKKRYLQKKAKLENDYLATVPYNIERFIKIPKSFFYNELGSSLGSNGYQEDGWILNLKGESELVFRAYNNPRTDILLTIDVNNNNSGISFVDQTGNLVSSGSFTNLFYLHNFPVFDDNLWNTNDANEVPFLFIDKTFLQSLNPEGNQFLLSPTEIVYADSFLGYNQWSYTAMKIECFREGTIITQPLGPHPVKSNFMILLPCPPQWNPAFSGYISQSNLS